MRYVLDANVALKWGLAEPDSGKVLRRRDNLVGAGSPDPAPRLTEGLPCPPGLETFGRPGGKVRRPCRNVLR